MDEAWAPSATWSPPAEGVLDVWWADLAAVGEDVLGPLSADERARARRFVRAQDGARWARAHGVLRALLARYLVGADPGALRFAEGPHGKPRLRGADAPAFNLSHSGGVALVAVARGREVGVDVEVARRPVDELAIAARALGAAEAARLAALAAPARAEAFLRAWARHEAALKCRGVGLAGAGEPPGEDAPWVAELELPDHPDAGAAVAADTPPLALRRWRWTE